MAPAVAVTAVTITRQGLVLVALALAGCGKPVSPPRSPQDIGSGVLQPAPDSPCVSAAELRARVPELLASGRLDRTLRVITRANELCREERGATVATEVRALAEIGRYETARALARQLATSADADQRSAADEALALVTERDRTFTSDDRRSMHAVLERADEARLAAKRLEPARHASERTTAYERAHGLYLEAWEAWHPNPEALFWAGRAALELGDAAEGQRLFDRAVVELERSTGTTLELDTRLGVEGRACAWSPDGTLLGLADDRRVQLVRREEPDAWPGTWRDIRTFEGHRDDVVSLAFSSDGLLLATASSDETARLWDVETGQLLQTLAGHTAPVSSVAFSPDGQFVATGSYDGTLRLWDVETGQLTLTMEHAAINDVAFSPDGQLLASKSQTETLRLWRPSTGKLLRTLGEEGVGGDASVVFSPDGRFVASGYLGDVVLWDVATGRSIRTFGGQLMIYNSLAFSPDGTLLASASMHGMLVWDVPTGEQRASFPGAVAQGSHALAFAADGKTMALAGLEFVMWQLDDANSGIGFPSRANQVRAAAFSPDGGSIATGNDDGALRLWSVDGPRRLRVLTGHSGPVRSLAFSPDGKRIASGSKDRTLRIWSSTEGRSLRRLEGHTQEVTSVTWSPDGRGLASGATDGSALLWSPVTGRLVRALDGDSSPVRAVAFSPDGATLAYGGDHGEIRVVEAATGQLLRNIVGHRQGVTSLAFSADGETLASGSLHGSVQLWRMPDADRLPDLESHTDTVSAVAFDPVNDLVASGSMDRTVRLWAPETGELLRTLRGHRRGVTSVAFSPDGGTLVSGSEDATVRLWDVATGTELLTLHGLDETGAGYAHTPAGLIEIFGTRGDDVRHLLNCRVGAHLFPFELCAERLVVEDLLPKVLGRDASYLEP